MNWMVLGEYFINLDNVCFVIAEDTQTKIGFIGGQSMNVDIPTAEVKQKIEQHHIDRGIT